MRRVFLVALILLGLIVPTVGTVQTPQAAAATCAPVHFIGLRGSGETKDTMGKVVTETFTKFQSRMKTKGKVVSSEAIKYPAQQVWPPKKSDYTKLTPSVNQGVKLLAQSLLIHVKACPNQKLIISGYSQGSWVANWTLNQLSSSLRQKITGVLLYGDPLFDPNDTHAAGSFDKKLHGIFGASKLPTSPAARTFCSKGDLFCNSSVANTNSCGKAINKCPHFKYSQYTTSAANWLAGLFPSAPPKVTPPKPNISITRLWTQDKNGVDDNAFPCTGSTNRVIHYRVSLNNTFKTPVTAKAVLTESWGGKPLDKSTTFQPGQVEFFIPSDSPQSKPGLFSYTLTITYPGGTVSKKENLTLECASI